MMAQGSLGEKDLKGRAGDPRALIEPTVALPLTLERERIRSLKVALGVDWNSHWQSLFYVQNHEAVEQNLSTQYQYLVLRWKNGPWSLHLGGGLARSDLFAPHGSVVGGLRWEIMPSIKLF
jgi:hypothetical protein